MSATLQPPPGRRTGQRRLSLAAAVAATATTAALVTWGAAPPADAAVGAGTYKITNAGGGKCLELPGGSSAAGVQLVAANCGTSASQVWTLASVSGGFRITGSSGLCVGVKDASTSAGKVIQQEACTGAASQTWSMTASGSNYRLVNVNADKCANTKDNSTSAGALVQTNSCDSAATKQWTFTPTSGGGNPTTTTNPPGSTTTTTRPPTTTTTPPPSGNTVYIAPGGRDGATGTISDPTTLTSAISRIGAGGTIYARGGTYAQPQTVTIAPGNNGTASARKNLFAYQGETPVFNFSAQSEDPANRGLAVNGNYWHVRGIVVERAGDNGIFVGGSNNTFERTVTRFNRDTGLQLSRATSDTPQSQWPANNLVLSAVSHDNADSDGEDADGFAAKLTSGPGNVFRYAVAHNNIDDGWDLYTKTDTGPIGAVTIEDSLALNNGTLSDGSQAGNGDRNGFKLGGEDIGVNHVVRRNIAYNNGKHGFTYNRNLGTIQMTGNVGVNSAERNFNFDGGSSSFSGNTSCHGSKGSNDRTVGSVDSTNQFYSGTNGSRCSAYSGTPRWSFASDGRLVVAFG